MNSAAEAAAASSIFKSSVLRTYRTKADLDDIVPNGKQPRLGPKIDKELQRQIEANGELFGPLLVEPPPHSPGSFRRPQMVQLEDAGGAGQGGIPADPHRAHG